MKNWTRRPNPAAGAFAVIFGGICLILATFVASDPARRLSGAGFGLKLLGWGSSQIVAARRVSRESKDAKVQDEHAAAREYQPQDERLEELEKSGSMSNVLVLLTWVLLSIAALFLLAFGYLILFHRGR